MADCQLKVVYEATSTLNLLDRFWLIRIRLRAAFLRRAKRVGMFLGYKSVMKTDRKSKLPDQRNDKQRNSFLNAGDMVQILSFDEIRKTLDENSRTQGLMFMPAMRKFCGTKRKVMKRVNYMFDERALKMRKIKNVVILEGVICEGEDIFSREGCDRSCFFFWKEAWLEKI